jgi:hypothetical protein
MNREASRPRRRECTYRPISDRENVRAAYQGQYALGRVAPANQRVAPTLHDHFRPCGPGGRIRGCGGTYSRELRVVPVMRTEPSCSAAPIQYGWQQGSDFYVRQAPTIIGYLHRRCWYVVRVGRARDRNHKRSLGRGIGVCAERR